MAVIIRAPCPHHRVVLSAIVARADTHTTDHLWAQSRSPKLGALSHYSIRLNNHTDGLHAGVPPSAPLQGARENHALVAAVLLLPSEPNEDPTSRLTTAWADPDSDDEWARIEGPRHVTKMPRELTDIRWVDDLADGSVTAGWWRRKGGDRGVGGDPVLRYPAVHRLVALGDIHGSIRALRGALTLAGAVDPHGTWIGGELVIVQVGDLLDRGNDELLVLRTLERLKLEARAAGGDIHMLLGNHETMNVEGRFVCAPSNSMSGYKIFDDEIDSSWSPAPRPTNEKYTPVSRSRVGAFAPGGPLAAGILSERNVATIVGRTLFVHGGLPKKYAHHLDGINAFARKWLRGGAKSGDSGDCKYRDGMGAMLWCRDYSSERGRPTALMDRVRLRDTLNSLGVDRMVVGHTVQTEGINQDCGGRVWRIDTGMWNDSNPQMVQALELVQDGQPRVLNSDCSAAR